MKAVITAIFIVPMVIAIKLRLQWLERFIDWALSKIGA